MTEHLLPQDADDDLSSMLSTFQAGDEVLHYRIIQPIGEGGMGEVYKAIDLKLDRIVALKVLSPFLKKDPIAAKRLIQEAKSASALHHPYIVTIFAIEEWKDMTFLVMEYLEGQSLGVRLSFSPLSLADILEIGAQTAEALGAAHAAGLIHRDIKPQNIMITSNEEVQIKLLDFGLAKKIPNPNEVRKDVTKLTTVGVPIGTIPYMSPEQTRAETLDSRTDIFSLGTTLYEAATRVSPYEGNSILKTMDNIANVDPVPPSELIPGLPVEFDEILHRALAKEKEDRFQSAFEFAKRLRELKAELGPEFHQPIQPSQIPAKPSRSTPPKQIRTAAQPQRPVLLGLTASIILLALIGISLFYFFNRGGTINSIAVLPFSNVNANPEDEYLSEGITETIISNLSQIPRLRVMARTTVFRYQKRKVDPQQIGRELNLDAVVTGSIYRQGETLVVQANLVRVSDGSQIWGNQYNQKISDMLTVQSEISKDISERLRLKLTGTEEDRVTKQYTANPEAYETYLKALYFWNRRTVDFDHMRKALEYFELATQKDPNYALAYTGVSDAYVILGNFQLIPSSQAYSKAEEVIRKAIALDDSLAEAHISYAGLRESQLDWETAGIEYQKGLALKANYPLGLEWYGLYLIEMGRTKEGIEYIKKAVELDPFALIMNAALGLGYYYDRQYDLAIETYLRTLELDPNQSLYGILAEAYEQKGMEKEMIAEYIREFKLASGKPPEVIKEYQAAYERGGILAWRQKDLEEELKEAAKGRHYFQVAVNYAALGKNEQAFYWLQKAVDEKNIDLWMLRMKVDPRCDPLRSDPRFNKILRQLGL